MGDTDWSLRLAGGLLVVLGVLNVVVGVLSLATDLVLLSAGTASALLVAGIVTTAAGVLVWRGSRIVTYVALTVLGLLFLVQLTTPVDTASMPQSDPSRSPLVRNGGLGLVVAALALAGWRLRRRRGHA